VAISALESSSAEYCRVDPGVYRAVCVEKQGPELSRIWKQYRLRLGFSLLDDGSLVSMFLNLGAKAKMPGARSNIYRLWTLVKGRRPRPKEQCSLDCFVNPHILYTVRVDYSADGKRDASDPMAFSRVVEVVGVER
jgi:hypothetical protein